MVVYLADSDLQWWTLDRHQSGQAVVFRIIAVKIDDYCTLYTRTLRYVISNMYYHNAR